MDRDWASYILLRPKRLPSPGLYPINGMGGEVTRGDGPARGKGVSNPVVTVK